MAELEEDNDPGREKGESPAVESPAGAIPAEALNRYLAAAAGDREAAEERSSQVIARFTKLTLAMMCLTTVIAIANVVMIVRQANVAQPPTAALPPPRPPETPAPSAPPAESVSPRAVPTESVECPQPAEKVPLLGSPPPARVRPATTPTSQQLARATTVQPHPRSLLTAKSDEGDEGDESGQVERW